MNTIFKFFLLLISCLPTKCIAQSYEALIDSANVYLNTDDETAHRFLQKAIKLQLTDSSTLPVEKLAYAEILKRNRHNPAIIKSGFWLKAVEDLRQYGNPAHMAYAFLSVADRYRVKDRGSEAKIMVDSALIYAKQLDYGYYSGVAHAMMGLIYVEEANYYEARKSFKANLALTKTDPPIQAYIRSFIELSTLYTVPEQIDSVFYYLNESIRLSDQIKYRRYQARARVELAQTYIKIGNCDSALYFIEEAKQFALKGDTMEVLRFDMAAATINLSCNKKEEALLYIDHALKINETTLQDFKLIDPIALKASYLIDSGQKREGYKLYASALKKLHQSDRINTTIKNSLNLLNKIKQEDPAITEKELLNEFEKVLITFEDEEYLSLEKEDSLELMELNAWYQFKTKQAGNAYKTLDRLFQIQKENYNQELVNKRLQLEGIYQLSERELQLATEKELSNQLKVESERKNLIILFVSIASILLLVILIILFYTFKQRREKLQLQEEVNQKRIALAEVEINNLSQEIAQNKKELTAYTLEVIDKNNLLRSISSSLKKARKDQDFTSIERELNLGLKEKKDWKEFRERFEKVDAKFLEKLKQNYPDLTSGQIRLASLIKLGFSSKQIAEFLNHTPASVDVARSKLRKKLNISKDDEIADFLSSI